MNFLAHLALSANDEDLIIGNFIADTVRKVQYPAFSTAIVRGILLHHHIDEYTDKHATVASAKQLITAEQGKYRGVVLDIIMDHFLAVHFEAYYQEPLESFAERTYEVLSRRSGDLSRGAQRILPYMMEGDWLLSYRSIAGMQKVFNGMSRRTRFSNRMAEAPQQLQQYYRALEGFFHDFYPQLQKSCQHYLNKNP